MSLHWMESSTKCLMFELIELVMSFKYIRQRTGSRAEPWGTLDMTFMGAE